MSSGLRNKRLINKQLNTVLLFLVLSPALADEWSLQSLMKIFSGVESLIVNYQEEKNLSLLHMPLISEGVLEYRKPDYLKKAMHKPMQESFIADKEMVSISRRGEIIRQMAMDDYPPLTAFVTAYLGLLGGNQTALETYYEYDLSGGEDNWRLVLEPRQKSVQKFLQKIIIHGSKNKIQRINSIDAEGDSSLMTLQQ